MKTKSIANWFGSNRTLAATVGKQLGKCQWVGVPFCGGCCELPFIRTRSGMASDLHRHVINLARTIRDESLKHLLARRLDETLFHPDELRRAQQVCMAREHAWKQERYLLGLPRRLDEQYADDTPSVEWAWAYFVCNWMGRGGNSGTSTEFNQSTSVRWNANGGDSCTRFRSAADSLDGWAKALKPWNFVVLDVFNFLRDFKDMNGHGLYCDPPWPEVGDGYKHPFDESKQRRLAKALSEIESARVVVRYGDHPLIRELYPETRWTWIRQTSRAQTNDDVDEVLILNGPSYATEVQIT